jgi:hypothetical protein
VFSFLASPALTLAYYLFLFFSIEASLFIAWWQWRRLDSFRAYRLTIAFGSLTGLVADVHYAERHWHDISRVCRGLAAPLRKRVVTISSLGFPGLGLYALLQGERVLLALYCWLLIPSSPSFSIFWRSGCGPAVISTRAAGRSSSLSGRVALVLFGAINCAMKMDDERMFALYSFAALLAGYVLHLFFSNS